MGNTEEEPTSTSLERWEWRTALSHVSLPKLTCDSSSGWTGDRFLDLPRRNHCDDAGTHAHNTLSAGNTNVQVFYPFHPLRGATLEILRSPKRGDGAVCVMDRAGRRLKIPVWMLLPECTEIKISQQPHLGKEALLSLASLIASQLDSKDPVHDNLLQTTVNGCEGDRRGATSISGPDDPKGMRRRANGRSDTRRSDRSHGPRSGSGLSRGGGKRQ